MVLSTRDIIPIDQFGDIMWDVLTAEEAAHLRERIASERRIEDAARAIRRRTAFAALGFAIGCIAFGIFAIVVAAFGT